MLHDGKQASQFFFVCVIYNIYLIYIHVNIFFYAANLASSF